MVLSVSEPYLLSGDFVLCFDCVGQWFYLFPSLTCLVGIEMCCVVLCFDCVGGARRISFESCPRGLRLTNRGTRA